MKTYLACVLALSAMLGGCSGTTSAVAANQAEEAVLIPLSVKTADRTIAFRVEVARSFEEQQRGLMFRTQLPDDGGMIFPFATPRPASFWMKNTLIPLDMIFIRQDGSIARIAREATPHSLAPVDSGEPVIAVFEIAGGRSDALGIREGDKVSWEGGPQPR